MKVFDVTLPDGRKAIEVERSHAAMGGSETTWVYYRGGKPLDPDPRDGDSWAIEGVTERREIKNPDHLLAELIS